MLEIEIDGKSVQVEDGSTVMDAAVKVGVYIPHFCYHKKLSIAANCRMCLVEVEKAPKPLPACATPVTNGMKVKTHSPLAQKAQKGVMEFLLINHPLDCPICDQGGECQLQDLAVGYGADASRYQEEKRVVFNKDLGPLISTDMTRCINCTRCVRFTTEIGGMMELGQAFRGEHAEIMPFLKATVDSELSGNIIDLCPVGALTSKPFRYSARTWELSRRRSISPHDGVGANQIVQTKYDNVMRVLPYENAEVNECWLSDKDRFSYPALNSPDRLRSPEIKESGQWRKVDWQTALERAAQGLKSVLLEKGAEEVGTLISPHATLEEMHLAQKLTRALGSDNIDFRLRQVDFRGDALRIGVPTLGISFSEIEQLDRLFIVGSFLRKEAPLLANRVRQAAKRGLRVSSLHAVRHDWLLPVAQEVCVKPSEMPEVLIQVVKALATRTERTMDDLSLETVQVGDAAQQLADELMSGKKVAVWLGGFAQRSERFAELESLARLIANLCDGRFGLVAEAANTVGGYHAKVHPLKGGGNATDMLETPRSAYLLFNVEPSRDLAKTVAGRRALGAARWVVACAVFDSPEIRELADVLLPVAPYTEMAGTFVNMEGRFQTFVGVAKPQGESRPGWKVLRVLANLLDLPGFDYANVETVRAELKEDFSAPSTFQRVLYVPRDSFSDLERVADIPLYAADMLVRRAIALQKTREALAASDAWASSTTLASLGVKNGETVQIRQTDGSVIVKLFEDDLVAQGCIRLAGALDHTAALGSLSATLTVERVQ